MQACFARPCRRRRALHLGVLLGGGRLRVLRLGAVDAQALGAVFRLNRTRPDRPEKS
jgi:hypothetical protein